MGGFERGLGFDGVAGGMCKSACVTVVIKFRLGMHSSASSVTFRPFSLALMITASLGGETSVIVGVATLAGMGGAGT